MHERLVIARQLLADDGVIFISIDDNEQAQLKLLCDEVFGENNLLSQHHIQVRYENKSLNEKNDFQPLMEYILIYAKNKFLFKANKPYETYNIDKFIYEIQEIEDVPEILIGNKNVKIFKEHQWKVVKHSTGKTNLLKETWASGSVLKGNTSGKFFDQFISPRKNTDGLNCLYKVSNIGEDGLGFRYFTGPKKTSSKRGKFYSGIPLSRLEEINNNDAVSKKYNPIVNFIDYSAAFGNIRHEGGVSFNSGKKPLIMIKQLINYHLNKNATILDFFAGSGTTGHAVAQLNKEDGGKRRYILCTNNENNICEEVTYQRLKNIQNELPHNLKYLKTAFIPKTNLDEDNHIREDMLKNIIPLIELQYGLNFDTGDFSIVYNEEDVPTILENAKDNSPLFHAYGVLFSRDEQAKIRRKNLQVISIPEYYFKTELQEAGEL